MPSQTALAISPSPAPRVPRAPTRRNNMLLLSRWRTDGPTAHTDPTEFYRNTTPRYNRSFVALDLKYGDSWRGNDERRATGRDPEFTIRCISRPRPPELPVAPADPHIVIYPHGAARQPEPTPATTSKPCGHLEPCDCASLRTRLRVPDVVPPTPAPPPQPPAAPSSSSAPPADLPARIQTAKQEIDRSRRALQLERRRFHALSGTASDHPDGRPMAPEHHAFCPPVAPAVRPRTTPGPPRLCQNECGRAANRQSGGGSRALWCCGRCFFTGGREHSPECGGGAEDDATVPAAVDLSESPPPATVGEPVWYDGNSSAYVLKQACTDLLRQSAQRDHGSPHGPLAASLRTAECAAARAILRLLHLKSLASPAATSRGSSTRRSTASCVPTNSAPPAVDSASPTPAAPAPPTPPCSASLSTSPSPPATSSAPPAVPSSVAGVSPTVPSDDLLAAYARAERQQTTPITLSPIAPADADAALARLLSRVIGVPCSHGPRDLAHGPGSLATTHRCLVPFRPHPRASHLSPPHATARTAQHDRRFPFDNSYSKGVARVTFLPLVAGEVNGRDSSPTSDPTATSAHKPSTPRGGYPSSLRVRTCASQPHARQGQIQPSTRDVSKSDPESPLTSLRAPSCPERSPRLVMGAL